MSNVETVAEYMNQCNDLAVKIMGIMNNLSPNDRKLIKYCLFLTEDSADTSVSINPETYKDEYDSDLVYSVFEKYRNNYGAQVAINMLLKDISIIETKLQEQTTAFENLDKHTNNMSITGVNNNKNRIIKNINDIKKSLDIDSKINIIDKQLKLVEQVLEKY